VYTIIGGGKRSSGLVKTKKLRTQIYGKFNAISSDDENRYKISL
jgi:hypothetical protein